MNFIYKDLCCWPRQSCPHATQDRVLTRPSLETIQTAEVLLCWITHLSTHSGHSRDGNCLSSTERTSGNWFSLVLLVFTFLAATLVAGSTWHMLIVLGTVSISRGWVTGNTTAYDYLGNKFCPSIYSVQNNMNIW